MSTIDTKRTIHPYSRSDLKWGSLLIAGAFISAFLAIYFIYLLVDTLRSGCAYTPPVGRYFRHSNPWMYWIATLQIALVTCAGLFTFVQCLLPLFR